MTEPTQKSDIAPRLASGGTRDPFLELTSASQRIRDKIVAALHGIAPKGAFLKITNVVIRNGEIDAAAIVIEVRKS